ncbi:hypothetical protein THRCLA_20055 [Thraustotheca clavata]|uniref:Uncharacterized protein n=1 Tax=Thraustotheca clavata TaxID=74557 RepID=A0A1W0AC02_9STRA|nr:hypothetical protein THRCLA_20055 [Thraustotheca clavata]
MSSFMLFRTNESEPKYTTRSVDTVIFESSAKWPKYLGKASAIQMYTAAALSTQIIVTLPETATMLEKIATAGPLASLSDAVAVIFFGAKYIGERVITNVTSVRTVGQREESVKITVAGGLRTKTFECLPKDLKFVTKDEKGMCTIKINRTTFWLDTSKAQELQEQSLNILLSGKPLLVRKGKLKKASRV